MNKIFKVVWSKSKNCYVVVSEFAKNNSGKKKIIVATIFAALAMSSASISMASNDVPEMCIRDRRKIIVKPVRCAASFVLYAV